MTIIYITVRRQQYIKNNAKYFVPIPECQRDLSTCISRINMYFKDFKICTSRQQYIQNNAKYVPPHLNV